jgi:hypothetical protein
MLRHAYPVKMAVLAVRVSMITVQLVLKDISLLRNPLALHVLKDVQHVKTLLTTVRIVQMDIT